MFKVVKLHHVSLVSSNIEKSKTFYRDILGLKELERPNFGFDGAWFAIGDEQLHLIVDKEMNSRPDRELNSREAHFAIRVADYHETIKWLKDNNVRIIEKPDSQSGFAQIFCSDPDGNLIELHVEQKDFKKQ
ncbi:VOC family protein [Bacillus suaedae]|uniref:VOC family protein n=1 Tax=Halalkalibacter suaedae TaxID=2822140 RepID=A0A940WXW7_9BACI|nr:VOC family protein [Bacillus suaedae]MBP3952727.1 VOC family protein [Bacillus suaedae]